MPRKTSPLPGIRTVAFSSPTMPRFDFETDIRGAPRPGFCANFLANSGALSLAETTADALSRTSPIPAICALFFVPRPCGPRFNQASARFIWTFAASTSDARCAKRSLRRLRNVCQPPGCVNTAPSPSISRISSHTSSKKYRSCVTKITLNLSSACKTPCNQSQPSADKWLVGSSRMSKSVAGRSTRAVARATRRSSPPLNSPTRRACNSSVRPACDMTSRALSSHVHAFSRSMASRASRMSHSFSAGPAMAARYFRQAAAGGEVASAKTTSATRCSGS
mmetsp:Transcript_86165/g.240994  ORF Transcript_86165/g.240994 Transcript_86165/m.240994 type:complete len:279 (+) Transcript_86165:124-960(+)